MSTEDNIECRVYYTNDYKNVGFPYVQICGHCLEETFWGDAQPRDYCDCVYKYDPITVFYRSPCYEPFPRDVNELFFVNNLGEFEMIKRDQL